MEAADKSIPHLISLVFFFHVVFKDKDIFWRAPFVSGTVELHFGITGPVVVFRQHLGSWARVQALGPDSCP